MYKLCVFLVFKTREPSSNYMYDSLIKSHLSPSQLNFYASQYTYARVPVCVYTYAHTHIHTYMHVCVCLSMLSNSILSCSSQTVLNWQGFCVKHSTSLAASCSRRRSLMLAMAEYYMTNWMIT